MFKVNFINYKTLLIADIIEMPESLRSTRGEKVLAINKKYSIKSVSCPAIGAFGEVLFVRGLNKGNDQRIPIYDYNTQEEAVKAKYNFEELVKEINEKYKGDDGTCPF